MNTARFEIRVPLNRGDGTPVETAEVEAIEALLHASGNFTRHMAHTQWRDEEEALQTDTVAVYTIDVEDGYASGPGIQRTARHIASSLGCGVYVAWNPVTASLVTP